MVSVQRIIDDDRASTSHSLWLRERASLEIDYAAYGEPDAIVGLATDPWVDFTGDGIIDFFDTQAFMAHLSAEDPEADRNNDSEWDFYDLQFYLADLSTASQPLSPTGKRNAEENPFGLAGYRHDAITGLYHVRNRVLDPMQGRWLQRDPAGFVDGGNVYAYVRANPITVVDPMGMWKYMPGMGTFSADLGVGEYEMDSSLQLHFDPDEKKFQSRCCPRSEANQSNADCCEEVRFIQVYHSNLRVGSYFNSRNTWYADSDTRPYLYPYGRWTDPTTSGISIMHDTPGYTGTARGLYLRSGYDENYIRQQFYTCAICSKGGEDAVGEVYGCVYWMHHIEAIRDMPRMGGTPAPVYYIYQAKRQIESSVISTSKLPPGSQWFGNASVKGISGKPPSTPIREKILYAW